MKQLKNKIANRIKKSAPEDTPGRITNETVAEHRERILAGGRKFKYPVQYSKHKLLINTVIISVAALLLGSLMVWYQLYVVQSTSNLTYRVAQLLPLPVASIDGQAVRYSDYLMKYRSSIHFLEAQDNFSPNTADGKRQIEFIKRQQLDTALKDAYVVKLANELDVAVSDDEVSDFINQDLKDKKVSEQAFERTVLADYYGWSMSEYRSVVKTSLLKRKVAFQIDTAARDKAEAVREQLRKGSSFENVAKRQSDDNPTKGGGGLVGWIEVDAPDPDGIISELERLKEGRTTGLIQGRDAYYIAKLNNKSDGRVNYSIIKIDLTELGKRFDGLKGSDKIREYIDIEEEQQS